MYVLFPPHRYRVDLRSFFLSTVRLFVATGGCVSAYLDEPLNFGCSVLHPEFAREYVRVVIPDLLLHKKNEVCRIDLVCSCCCGDLVVSRAAIERKAFGVFDGE